MNEQELLPTQEDQENTAPETSNVSSSIEEIQEVKNDVENPTPETVAETTAEVPQNEELAQNTEPETQPEVIASIETDSVSVIPASEHEESLEEEEHEISFSDKELTQLKNANKAELMELAKQASLMENVAEAAQNFRKIRPYLNQLWAQEKNEALAKFIEEGGKQEEFVFEDASKAEHDQYYKAFAQRREEYKKKLDEEKNRNLIEKRKILEEIKTISELEENTESLAIIKDLQARWKAIRTIPMEHREELSAQYNHFLNTFYDKLSINYELKELDRKRNLETKIELVKKMDELKNEGSNRKALAMHKILWEEWKNTGPVPKEFREDIFNRFKVAADEVFGKIQEELNAMDAERQANLEQKVALCEKAEEYAKFNGDNPKSWIANVAEVNQLFDAWKAIGPAPLKYSESTWERFKQALDTFYLNKNNYFKLLQAQRMQNLKEKTALCEKAEALMNEDNWLPTTKEMIRLQDEWKKIGPIPEKSGEKLWQRFRSACDTFFNRKNEHFSGVMQDQTKNLEAKQDILNRLEELVKLEDNTDLSNKIKALQDEWNTYGFVPIKQKEQIQKRYKVALDALYGRIRKDFASNSRNRQRSQYEVIARQSEGKNMLTSEERRIQDRIKILRADIDTLQNNIGFFANSKNALSLTKQVHEQIEQAQRKMSGLMEQLRVLRDVKAGKPAPEAAAETASEQVTETPESEG